MKQILSHKNVASQNNNTASSYWCIVYGGKDCPGFNRTSKNNTHGHRTYPAKGAINFFFFFQYQIRSIHFKLGFTAFSYLRFMDGTWYGLHKHL